MCTSPRHPNHIICLMEVKVSQLVTPKPLLALQSPISHNSPPSRCLHAYKPRPAPPQPPFWARQMREEEGRRHLERGRAGKRRESTTLIAHLARWEPPS